MLENIIGSGPELSLMEMAIRAFFIFIIALVLIRIAGIRAFGMKSAFDIIIILLLGAILSHAVYASSPPFFSIVIAGFVIVVMHRLFAVLSIYSDAFGKLVKGDRILLLQDGKAIRKNMRQSLISHKDLDEGIRMSAHTDKQEDIEAAYLERNGHISVIKKESNNRPD